MGKVTHGAAQSSAALRPLICGALGWGGGSALPQVPPAPGEPSTKIPASSPVSGGHEWGLQVGVVQGPPGQVLGLWSCSVPGASLGLGAAGAEKAP